MMRRHYWFISQQAVTSSRSLSGHSETYVMMETAGQVIIMLEVTAKTR